MEQTERQKRFEQYSKEYSEQLRLQGYIDSLEKDNSHIRDAVTDDMPGRQKRRAKKLIKINDKDIKIYKTMLSKLPPLPEFK